MTQLVPGDVFAARFAIERQAGSGAMGTVYRARDRSSGEVVALKLVQREGAVDAERFTRESQILAQLRHPHIVAHVADGETADGLAFLAMAWLDGEDLAERLARGPLPLPSTLALVAGVASALAHAHARGVIHRDLKPSNVFLVDGDPREPRVLDFGVARQLAGSAITRAGTVLGTPGYMAPEQALGARELGPAADVFALGCILYECLAGEAPFHAATGAVMLARILFDEPASLAARVPGLSSALVGLCTRMLHKDPTQRPSADEVVEALRGAAPD